MINNRKYLVFKQGDTSFYMITLDIDKLLGEYIIDCYDSESNIDGYQRHIQNSHRKKIIDYLINEDNPILNTAIIGAIDINDMVLDKDVLSIKNMLKIVDGQHRIEAFKELKRINNDLYNQKFINYEVSVIVIPTDKSRILEMETFININNKNKRVSTALAEQVLEKIRQEKKPEIYNSVFLGNTLSKSEKDNIVNSICNRISNHLNDDHESIWFKLIKVGDKNTVDRVISINAFINSLNPIVIAFVNKFNEYNLNTDSVVNELLPLIEHAWSIVKIKWKDAFNIKYYNIQKGIGVYPIHSILAQCMDNNNETAIEDFEKIVTYSNIKAHDWYIGGNFSPLNSKAGFKEIELYIKNLK